MTRLVDLFVALRRSAAPAGRAIPAGARPAVAGRPTTISGERRGSPSVRGLRWTLICLAILATAPPPVLAQQPGALLAADDRMLLTTADNQRPPAAETTTTSAIAGTAPVVTDNTPVPRERSRAWYVMVMLIVLYSIVFLICVYMIRHYWFTLNRLFGEQRHPYLDVDEGDWPTVTVLVPAHNEEAVIAHNLEALLDTNYPHDKLVIVPVNDRSTDRTKEIIDDFARRYPDNIKPFHRTEGQPGKSAALRDVTETVDSDVLLVFDADYIPGRGLIKQLTSPFFDPEVGAVMGRVVPMNCGKNLLTRLLDLERAGGYQVDQQARMNLRLVPQYGGTVGGVRMAALESVGGWREDALAEDTEITYRLLLAGWKTVYQNRSECYEEVPEVWPVRIRQIKRWAKGHNQVAFRYGFSLLGNRRSSFFEKLDGILLLGVYLMAPILMLGWILALSLFFLGENPFHSIIAILSVVAYGALGNFAAFFEIAAATRLDGATRRLRLLPLNILGFIVSVVSITGATLSQALPHNLFSKKLVWHKTERYRKPVHKPT